MNPIVLKNSLWNKLATFLLRKKLAIITSDRGIELDRDAHCVVREFEGTPIVGPRKGFSNWLIWAFFLNELDGVIGDSRWNPERKDTFMIRLKWWLRNPCHNLTWHVLGFAQKPSTRVDFQLEDAPGWNYAMTLIKNDIGYFTLYPYCLYFSPKIKFYIGWRGRGTFGIKFNIKSGA
jgi:hypothetical protein